MAFREVTGGGSISTYWPAKASERKEGDSVIGVYRDKMSRKNPDGSDSVLYVLEGADGNKVGVNSSTTIARAFEQIPQGSTVKIVYEGKARSQKTGREYNNFKVYVDDANQGEGPSDSDLTSLGF